MWLEIKQLTRLQIIRYCEKLEKENEKQKLHIEELEEVNKKLKAELEIYKKQYEHSMWYDYIDEDLYDLDC